jgi:Right handed beta helix region
LLPSFSFWFGCPEPIRAIRVMPGLQTGKIFHFFLKRFRFFSFVRGEPKRKKKLMRHRTLPLKTRILFLSAMLGAAIVSLPTAQAATITVINTNDTGPGSLRQALVMAKDGDRINFDASLNGHKIKLTSGQLNVNKDITISGAAVNQLAVDGNAQSRVFYINPGKTVTINGLTVKNGASDDGAGIYNNQAVLTVSNCTISGNSADIDGGGIYNYAAALTVNNCSISGNSGGGIYNLGTTLKVSNCTITGNDGTGIYNFNAALTVSNCVIGGNSGSGISSGAHNGGAILTINNSTVNGNSGGGISSGTFDGVATLTVSNCTISGNSANVYGGGILSGAGGGNGAAASVTISNSTLSSNSAAVGGGIYNSGGRRSPASLSIKNCTISGNSATGNGSSIYNYGEIGFGGFVELGSTILNAGGSGENIFNEGGRIASLGYNVSSDDASGFLTGLGDQINTDPLLGPLQANGGPTFTHALLPGSPAINKGNPSFTPPPFYDQRGQGFDRVVNGRIDVGSFEAQ